MIRVAALNLRRLRRDLCSPAYDATRATLKATRFLGFVFFPAHAGSKPRKTICVFSAAFFDTPPANNGLARRAALTFGFLGVGAFGGSDLFGEVGAVVKVERGGLEK